MERVLLKLCLIGFCVFSIIAYSDTNSSPPPGIILYIGDGMGVSHITLGAWAAETLGKKFMLYEMKDVLLVNTSSKTGRVTDSAAGATALSTGNKTLNGMLGIDSGQINLKNISEILSEQGWSVGLVTTTTVTHATPAAFYAHDPNRSEEKRIARQIVSSPYIDVCLGGGRDMFPPIYMSMLHRQNVTVIKSEGELSNIKNIGERVLGVFADGNMSYAIDKRSPSLEDMTRGAIDYLESKKKPFFLMVESGLVDFASHVHDAPSLAREVLALNDALGVGLDYQKRAPGSLILVTADHSTANPGLTDLIDMNALMNFNVSSDSLTSLYLKTSDDTASMGIFRNLLPEDKIDTLLIHGLRSVDNPFHLSTEIGDYISKTFGVSFMPPIYQAKTSLAGHTGDYVPCFIAGNDAFIPATPIIDNTDIFNMILNYAKTIK